mmetsp:Transcript_22379/g.48853  ORF Transcript_22379/g.48853 Transcript_22379/m.48853 type:complete len:634 (+) Transcript_22379:88-1989(+)
MKAFARARQSASGATADIPPEAPQVPEVKIPIVRCKNQPRRHKVISFGYTVTVDGEVPDVYKFQYPPNPESPEEVYPGVIPAGFQAGVPCDETMIYFQTRDGAVGPEYQVAYTHPDNVLIEWSDDVDALWIETLQTLEDANELSEGALDFLDADPLYLFGIADPATQKALEKAATVPMLKCTGQRPNLEEWFAYLNADRELDKEFTWVIESMAEVELPPPWTSYKGIGSVVCYLNNETNETTWKHPFFDYFAKLLEHCRFASREEHIKLRINRMLWSYEHDTTTGDANQQPLVSPQYVKQMGDILRVDLIEEPYMVRTIKTFLKAFSQQYRLEEELDTQEVKWCLEIVENERAKALIARDLPFQEDPSDQIAPNAHGQLYCAECSAVASCYCPHCEDCFCQVDFERLHMKGNRTHHKANEIIPCCLCVAAGKPDHLVMPAKLQCTYTFASYCHECYARKHVKTLPKKLDLKPVKIDYTRSNADNVSHMRARNKAKPQTPPLDRVSAPGEKTAMQEMREGFSHSAPAENMLGEKWHAFYDRRGVRYFYNFETQESMRRPQDLEKEPKSLESGHKTLPLKGDAGSRSLPMLRQLTTSKAPRFLKTWTHKPEDKLPALSDGRTNANRSTRRGAGIG